ncbi:Calmodulin [Operophtera brumata]|uniref:Calmodulin n=1 Tax=Operophtera brumata TaxID=104452 RepID=A0A0L7L3D7_OPEBR|nr:Calmodulin [Operophtera brumata]
MAGFDVFNPLANITPRFTEEQLENFKEWFDEKSKPLLLIDDGPPIKVISIEDFMDFLQLKKLHRRSFIYPTYGEVMLVAERLKADVTRILTWEQFIYILDTRVLEPEIKHELLVAFKVEEIQSIVTTYADVFNKAEAIELMRDANVRGDGNVFYEQFIECMFSVAPELYNIKACFRAVVVLIFILWLQSQIAHR